MREERGRGGRVKQEGKERRKEEWGIENEERGGGGKGRVEARDGRVGEGVGWKRYGKGLEKKGEAGRVGGGRGGEGWKCREEIEKVEEE